MSGLSTRETNPAKRAALYGALGSLTILAFVIAAAAIVSPFAVVWFAALHWK